MTQKNKVMWSETKFSSCLIFGDKLNQPIPIPSNTTTTKGNSTKNMEVKHHFEGHGSRFYR